MILNSLKHKKERTRPQGLVLWWLTIAVKAAAMWVLIQAYEAQAETINLSEISVPKSWWWDFTPGLNIFTLQEEYKSMLDHEWFYYDENIFPQFVTNFWPILEYLYPYALSGDDVKIAYDLYVSWEEWVYTPEAFSELYDFFIAGYPNPEILLDDVMQRHGFSKEDYRVKA